MKGVSIAFSSFARLRASTETGGSSGASSSVFVSGQASWNMVRNAASRYVANVSGSRSPGSRDSQALGSSRDSSQAATQVLFP